MNAMLMNYLMISLIIPFAPHLRRQPGASALIALCAMGRNAQKCNRLMFTDLRLSNNNSANVLV